MKNLFFELKSRGPLYNLEQIQFGTCLLRFLLFVCLEVTFLEIQTMLWENQVRRTNRHAHTRWLSLHRHIGLKIHSHSATTTVSNMHALTIWLSLHTVRQRLQQSCFWCAPVVDINTAHPEIAQTESNFNVHLHKANVNYFLWSLSLLNVNTKLDSLWTHLEEIRFRFGCNISESSPIT